MKQTIGRNASNHTDEVLARDMLISNMQLKIEQIKRASIKSNEKFRAEMARQQAYGIELESRLQESNEQICSFWESVPEEIFPAIKGLLEEAEPQHPHHHADDRTDTVSQSEMSARKATPQHAARDQLRPGISMSGGNRRSSSSYHAPRPQSAPPQLNEVGNHGTSPGGLLSAGNRVGTLRPNKMSAKLRKASMIVPQRRVTSPTSPSSNESASVQSEWLSAFSQLLESAGISFGKNEGAEVLKCRERVRVEVERLMTTPDRSTKTFMSIVDSSDPLVRSNWLDEVAIHFRVVGMLLKVMHSMQVLSWSVLDANSSYGVFVNEVTKILAAETVQLWLVNQERGNIWKWDPNVPNPRQHAFATTYPGHDPSAEAVRHGRNAYPQQEQAIVFNESTNEFRKSTEFCEESQNTKQGFTICEPIYFDRSIVAVIECKSSEKLFAPCDETFLRLLAKYSGFLFRRISLFEDNLRMVESTMNIIALTRLYPSDESDIFALARVQLDHARVLLSAEQCVLYLVTREDSPESSGIKLWTYRVDGLCTRIEIHLGGAEESLVGWVAEHDEALILENPDSDPRFNYDIDTARSSQGGKSRARLTSVLATPMKLADTSLFGVCLMMNKRGGAFTQSDSRILTLVCDELVLGLTLDGSEHAPAPHESIHEALNRSRMLLACRRVALFRVNDTGTKLRLHQLPSAAGLEPPGEVLVPLSDDVLGYVARTGVTMRAADAREEPRFNSDLCAALQIDVTCFMCVPVMSADRGTVVVGALLCVNKHGTGGFSEQDEAMAHMLAKQILRIDNPSDLTPPPSPAPADPPPSELQVEPTHT